MAEMAEMAGAATGSMVVTRGQRTHSKVLSMSPLFACDAVMLQPNGLSTHVPLILTRIIFIKITLIELNAVLMS